MAIHLAFAEEMARIINLGVGVSRIVGHAQVARRSGSLKPAHFIFPYSEII
jgi:hypothetical protein